MARPFSMEMPMSPDLLALRGTTPLSPDLEARIARLQADAEASMQPMLDYQASFRPSYGGNDMTGARPDPLDADIMRAANTPDRNMVTVQSPHSPGFRSSIPGSSNGQLFGGDTTVREVGGRNMFVDRLKEEAMPEGGYLGSRERGFLADYGGMPMNREKARAAASLGSGVNNIQTYQYGDTGEMLRDEMGRPLKNPEVAQQRADYLASQDANAKESRDITRQKYQLKQMGMRAMPISDDLLRPGTNGVTPLMWMQDPKAAAAVMQGDPQAAIERDKMAMLERQGNANRASEEKIAGINAGARGGGDPLQKAQVGVILTAQEAGTIDHDEAAARIAALDAGGAAPAMPQDAVPNLPSYAYTVDPITKKRVLAKPADVAKEAKLRAMDDGAISQEEREHIDALLQRISDSRFASMEDPDGFQGGFDYVNPYYLGRVLGEIAPNPWAKAK